MTPPLQFSAHPSIVLTAPRLPCAQYFESRGGKFDEGDGSKDEGDGLQAA